MGLAPVTPSHGAPGGRLAIVAERGDEAGPTRAPSRWGRLGPTVPEEPQQIGRLTANGPSAGPLASAWVAAAPARLPAFLSAASAGHGRLNGTAPQGRRHSCRFG